MSFFELIKSIEFSFKDNTGSINKYIDTFLTRFKMRKRLLTKKDLYRIPNDRKYSIDDYIRVFDFVIFGLCSMIRESVCNFSFLDDGIKVDGRFSVHDVRLKSKFDFTSLFVLGGDVEATLSRLDVKIILVVTEHNVEIKSLQIIKMGRYEVTKICGINNAIAWGAKFWINVSPDPILKKKIIHTIEFIALESLAGILSTYETPFLIKLFVRLYKHRRHLFRHFIYMLPFLFLYFYSLLYFCVYYKN